MSGGRGGGDKGVQGGGDLICDFLVPGERDPSEYIFCVFNKAQAVRPGTPRIQVVRSSPAVLWGGNCTACQSQDRDTASGGEGLGGDCQAGLTRGDRGRPGGGERGPGTRGGGQCVWGEAEVQTRAVRAEEEMSGGFDVRRI